MTTCVKTFIELESVKDALADVPRIYSSIDKRSAEMMRLQQVLDFQLRSLQIEMLIDKMPNRDDYKVKRQLSTALDVSLQHSTYFHRGTIPYERLLGAVRSRACAWRISELEEKVEGLEEDLKQAGKALTRWKFRKTNNRFPSRSGTFEEEEPEHVLTARKLHAYRRSLNLLHGLHEDTRVHPEVDAIMDLMWGDAIAAGKVRPSTPCPRLTQAKTW